MTPEPTPSADPLEALLAAGPNGLDVAIVLIVLFMTWRGAFRGFFKEIFGLLGWVGGGLGGAIFYTDVAPAIAERWTLPIAIAEALGGLGIFLVTLLVCRFIGWALSRLTERYIREGLDMTAGVLLGFAKGIALCGVILLVFATRRGAPLISERIPDSILGSWLVEQDMRVLEIARAEVDRRRDGAAATPEASEPGAPAVVE